LGLGKKPEPMQGIHPNTPVGLGSGVRPELNMLGSRQRV